MAKTRKDNNKVVLNGRTYSFVNTVERVSRIIPIALTIEALHRKYLEGVITPDKYVQRMEGQWSSKQNSMLIYAILMNRPIGSFITATGRGEDMDYTVKSLIDGLQRTTAIVNFIENKYSIGKKTPPVACVLTDEETGETIETSFSIAGKRFKNLPKVLQEKILDYTITCYSYENFTYDELDEIMFCVNNGKAPTPYQKMRFALGSKNMRKIQPMCESLLWEDIPKVKAKNDSILGCVIRIFMLLSYKINSGFSAKAMNDFIEEFDDNVSDDFIIKTSTLIEQFTEVKQSMPDEYLTAFDACSIPHFILAFKNFINKKNICNKTFVEFVGAFLKSKEAKKFFAYRAPKKDEDRNDKQTGSGGTQYSAESIDERETALSDFLDDFLDAPLTDNINDTEENGYADQNETAKTADGNVSGEVEYKDRDTETEDDEEWDIDDTDLHGDSEDSRRSGGDRPESEEEYREAEVLQGDGLQIRTTFPLHTGH